MRRLLSFVFLSLLLLGKLACSGASSGGHSAEIDTVQHALVVNVARSGLKSSVSVAGWIKQQFYIGRFDVRWSADDNAGQIRVNANMQSQSVTKLERSIVLRFNVDPQDKSVVFAGMVLEGDELIAPSGKPYSLDGAVSAMWDRRGKTYLKDLPEDALEELRNGG